MKKLKEQEEQHSVKMNSNAKATTKVCAAIIGKIADEVKSDLFERWSIELVEEKIQLITKNEDKPLEAIIGMMENSEISPKEKEEALDEALTVQTKGSEIKAILRKRAEILKLKDVELLKQAYNDQIKQEEEEQERVRKLIEEKQKNDEALLQALCAKCHKMDGSYFQWLQFKAEFAEIHTDKNVEPLMKLKALKASCSGQALQILDSFEENEQNYEPAYEKLKAKYDDSYMQVMFALNKLNEIKQISKQTTSYFIGTIDECIRIAISYTNDETEAILSAIVLTKLDANLYANWEIFRKEKAMNEEQLPKWSVVKEYLQKECVVSAQSSASTQRNTTVQVSTSTSATASTWQQRVNFASRARFASQIPPCKLCGIKHAVFACSRYLQMSYTNKMKHRAEYNLCIKCLQDEHQGVCKDWRCEQDCKRCLEKNKVRVKHNSTLCPLKNQELNLYNVSDEEWNE